MKLSKEDLIKFIRESLSPEDFILDNSDEDIDEDENAPEKVEAKTTDWRDKIKHIASMLGIDEEVLVKEYIQNKGIVMKITEKELRTMVKEAVRKKLASLKLQEGNDFSARREIESAAAVASREFEQIIIKYLNLVPPDNLPEEVQRQYLDVVKVMEEEFIKAGVNAVQKLSRFPRNKTEG